jgi:hypothetical protein
LILSPSTFKIKYQVLKYKPEEASMCQNCCEQPIKLMDKPENCSPKQIKECHGNAKEHPCTKENCVPEKNPG